METPQPVVRLILLLSPVFYLLSGDAQPQRTLWDWRSRLSRLQAASWELPPPFLLPSLLSPLLSFLSPSLSQSPHPFFPLAPSLTCFSYHLSSILLSGHLLLPNVPEVVNDIEVEPRGASLRERARASGQKMSV